MKRKTTFNKTKTIVTASLAAAMLVISAVMLTGCSFMGMLFGNTYIEFTKNSLTLQVGESYNLSSIVDSKTPSYELISSDSKIVSVSGRTATAKSVGVAYITAETVSYSDRIRVTVTDVEPDALTLDSSGELIQTMGRVSTVTFTPSATGTVTNSDVTWYINGEEQSEQTAGTSFSFTPSAAGLYEVTAAAGGLTASVTVRCYYEVSAVVTPSGEFTQLTQPFSSIDFSVSVERNNLNPDDYIVWYEDDRLLYEGTETAYTYRPTAGRHTVYAYVNGNMAYRADGFFKGSITPDAPSIVFDNLYPHVYVTFDAAGEAQVEITSSETGVKTVCASTDPKYASLFSNNGFDAAEIITLCASSNTRRNYTLRVKSLGDGDALTESDYSESYLFTQLPSTAKKYIETVCLDTDLYLTSETEYVAVAEYYINSRKKTGSESSVAFECYVAFDLLSDELELWEDAFPIAATSGEYRGIRVSMSGNVLKTSFTVNTINTPSQQAPTYLGGGYAENLHAILPHFNYDTNKYRPDNYVFAIDRAEREASVTYTDELYLAVQRGVKPLPTAGSPAETVYELARNVLKKIVTDEMTDEDKAHAIYDWIMWHVTYDNPATLSATGGESYSAYYLEGVFADGVTPIGGVVYKPYAVCDGMSKAYSLLCNMEGIPCVRVVGTAGDSVASAGGHAWNKVYINNAWYGVDCTWGDATTSLTLSGFRSSEYELGMHDYLFVTENKISQEHYEPYASGDSSIRYAPVATNVEYSVYKNMRIHDAVINCFVAYDENRTERTREIASAYAKAYKKISQIAVPCESNGVSEIDWQAIEIYYEGGAPSDASIKTLITNAFKAEHRNAEIKVFTYGDILLILVKT